VGHPVGVDEAKAVEGHQGSDGALARSDPSGEDDGVLESHQRLMISRNSRKRNVGVWKAATAMSLL